MRAKTRQEIANEFGINRKTLYRWLKSKNITTEKGLITPAQQVDIYKIFGYPERKSKTKRQKDYMLTNIA